jgi:Cdc6-like AAA superfamily ATPase
MRTKKLNLTNFATINANFNIEADHVVSQIFQLQNEGVLGYVPAEIGDFSSKPLIHHALALAYKRSENFAESSLPITADGLGQFENLIFSDLAFGSYNTYILTGEMGSGKTALLKKLKEVLETPRPNCEKCSSCLPIVVYFNLNESSWGGIKNPERAKSKFLKKLRQQLRPRLRIIFEREDLTLDFVNKLQGDARLQTEFFEFDDVIEEIVAGFDSFTKLTAKQRTTRFFKLVEKVNDDYELVLEAFIKLARFVARFKRPDPTCFVIMYDNVDALPPEVQYEVLAEILSLQTLSQIRGIVALRQATFARAGNQAIHSFCYFPHLGPNPRKIVEARLKHFVDYPESYPTLSQVSSHTVLAIERRARYILASKHKPALDLLEKLAGRSTRLALLLAQRFFINNTVRCLQDPPHLNDLERALLVGKNETQQLRMDDQQIANIFVSAESGSFSLVILRILQMLEAYRETPLARTSRAVGAVLKVIYPTITTTAVKEHINYLLNLRRPIIWADGKSFYESPKVFVENDDVLTLTQAGHEYFSVLTTHLVYVQEAMVGIDWTEDEVPTEVNYASFTDRLDILRRFIKLLCERDKQEISRVRSQFGDTDGVQFLVFELLSTRILENIGKSVVSIVENQVIEESAFRSDTQSMMRDWHNLFLLALEDERNLSQKNDDEQSSKGTAKSSMEALCKRCLNVINQLN